VVHSLICGCFEVLFSQRFLRTSKRPENSSEGSLGYVYFEYSMVVKVVFEKLDFSSSFCASHLTDTKYHEKKVKKEKFFYFPLQPP